MPRLKMLRGPEPGLVIDLNEDRMTIGRGRKNSIIIHDNEVSREHCALLRVNEDSYEIYDLKSTNGTFVNGQALEDEGWLLTSRCIIELGDSITLQYRGNHDEDTGALSRISQPMKAVVDDATHYLVIHHRLSVPDVYLLDSSLITIGRDLNNDIVLTDAQVSRFHVRLVREDASSDYMLEDQKTMNGTYVDDKRIDQPVHLKNGQHIRLGTSVEMWYTHDPRSIATTAQVAVPDETFPSREALDPLLSQRRSQLTAGQLENHVFIVYARPEWQEIVAPLYHYLHENSVPTFVEQFYAPNSKEWEKALAQAQMECLCMVLVLTEASLEVEYVQRTLRHFMAREKPVLLVQYGDVSNPPVMIDNQPAIPYHAHNPQRAFRTILAEIRKLNNTLLA